MRRIFFSIPLLMACSSATTDEATVASSSGDTSTTSTGGQGGMSASSASDASSSMSSSTGGASECTLAANTTATDVVNGFGCARLNRDASACLAARTAQGLTGDWLKFSCRVKLTVDTSGATPFVLVEADSRPDYKSNYFETEDACWDDYKVPGKATPNLIMPQTIKTKVPLTPSGGGTDKKTNDAGVAVNGVWIFNDAAAPPDDIYKAVNSFDRCGGHPDPQNGGTYHYHIEPNAISSDDANLVGILRDGYFVYGRRDGDNSLATGLDVNGGHTGTTTHSPVTPVYHYHVVEQTSTTAGTLGQKAWFIAIGKFHGQLLK